MKFATILSVMLVAVFLVAGGAFAATGIMPYLYNSSGQAVNASGGTLAAGTYYLDTGATHPVTYFGDGSYYDPATNMYGGSLSNPSGQAGAILSNVGEATSADTSTTVVGVPNTGMGGNASLAFAELALAALAVAGGAAYLARSRYAAK